MDKAEECKGTSMEGAISIEERDTEVALVKSTRRGQRWFGNFSCRRAVEITIFVILIMAVWSLFALPTVFYLTSAKEGSPATIIGTSCSPVPFTYDNSVCRPFLKQYRKCVPTLSAQRGIYVSSSVNLQESEDTAVKIKSIESFLSSQCRAVALPFACRLLFPFCDDNHTAYLPSSEECTTVSTESCKGEWQDAKKLVSNIPDCSLLPHGVSHCKESILAPSVPSNLTSANCSEHFVFIGNHCLPACPHWVLRINQSNSEDVLVVVAVVVGLICGVLVILISFLRHKRMLVFPSILVVYQAFAIVVIAVFAILSFADAKALYCTAPDWVASLNTSTPFCQISGTVLFYGLMQIAFIWVCHVCLIFWSVVFPISFVQFKLQRKMKHIHVLVICLMIVVPLIPVVAVFGTGGFINARFPPLLCLSKDSNAAFYGLFLPISILLATGVSLMIGAFWTIRKRRNKNKSIHGAADIKTFIVFFYYVLLGVIALAAFTLNSKTSTKFISSLATYFSCEWETPRKCENFRKNVLQFTYPGLSDASYVVLALYPLVNLVYVFNFHELKEVCNSSLRSLHHSIFGRKS